MRASGQATSAKRLARRGFCRGIAIAVLLALPACTTLGASAPVAVAGDAGVVRRLVTVSARHAIARLAEPDGFWNSPVARVPLPVLFDSPRTRPGVLASDAFREDLQHRLNGIAGAGAQRGLPALERAAARLAIADPMAVLAGDPTAATTVLRQAMGPDLVNAMIPALEAELRRADDPKIAAAMAALKGVSQSDVAHALANEANNAIWYEVGAEEAAIRRDPASSGDAMLAAALKAP